MECLDEARKSFGTDEDILLVLSFSEVYVFILFVSCLKSCHLHYVASKVLALYVIPFVLLFLWRDGTGNARKKFWLFVFTIMLLLRHGNIVTVCLSHRKVL